MFDSSGVVLHAVIAVLTMVLAGIAYKTGKVVGFISFWRRILIGWILISVGRGILAVTDADIMVNSNAFFDLKDLGLLIILIGVLLLIWGSYALLKEMTMRNSHGN